MSVLNKVSACLFTSTKGHFDRRDIYKETVESLLSQCRYYSFYGLFAAIKSSAAEEQCANEMMQWLVEKRFLATIKYGDWKHGNQSHQIEYLSDMETMNGLISSPYFLHLEDDWRIKAYDNTLEFWLEEAVRILDKNPSIMQVRIPRFTNEPDRIRGLMAKHGIDGKVAKSQEGDFYYSNDWSNNPFVARTRDMRAALAFIRVSNLPKHSEHGISPAMKILSGSEYPFAFFDPTKIRCGHMGTPEGQEDNLDKDLFV